jgi:hypothetical protein
MASPGEGVLKPHFTVLWRVGAVLSIALLAIISVELFQTVRACDAKAPACTPIPSWIKLAYAAWTVGVPIYFMIEWVYGIDWKFALEPDNKPRLDYQKSCQDQARTVWAAFAAAIGILLLKYG